MNDAPGFDVMPVDVDGKRIDFLSLEKIKTGLIARRLFRSYGFLWHLEIKENDFFLSGGKPHFRRISGLTEFVNLYMQTEEGEKTVEIVVISIGTLSPVCIRDVILYHELRESFYMTSHGMSCSEAHKKAYQEEREYIRKYLSDSEKAVLENFRKEVQSSKDWEAKPVC